MQSSQAPVRILGRAGLLACAVLGLGAVSAVSGEIRLDQNTSINVGFDSKFGNTGPMLKQTLDKYLLKVLGRENLAGSGPRVAIELQCDEPSWRDLDFASLGSLQEIDRFTIDTTQPDKIVIHGRTVQAAAYGVYFFLEHYLGVFWLYPGALGECAEAKDHVALPRTTLTRQPKIASRLYTGLQMRDPAVVATRAYADGVAHQQRFFFYAYDYQKNLKLNFLFSAHHNLINIFPVEETARLYPELFPMKDGERRHPDPAVENRTGDGYCWHPCYANEKTVEVAVKKAREFFESKQGMVFSLGVNDGRKLQCGCPECEKLGPFPMPYYHFVNAVARQLKDKYPPCMVAVLAYNDVAVPPAGLELEPNVLVNTTGMFDQWRKVAKSLSVYQYLYGWGYWVPNLTLRALKENARIFEESGVIGYQAETYPVWPFDGPKLYINSELQWDPDLDVDAALRQYCRAGYGDAWEPVYQFYKTWMDYHGQPVQRHGLFSTAEMDEAFRRSTGQFGKVDGTIFRRARESLEKAKELAKSDTVKKRLGVLDTFFSYSETCFEIYRLRDEIFDAGTARDWPALSRGMAQLLNKRQSLIADFQNNPEWFEGSLMTPKEIFENVRGNTWETRWEWSLDYEGQNALHTALFQANRAAKSADVDAGSLEAFPGQRALLGPFETEPLKLRVLHDGWSTHFHPDLNRKLRITESGETVQFATNPDDPEVEVPEESVHRDLSKTGLKKAAFVGLVKLEQGKPYFFKIGLKGSSGTARLLISNENDNGKKVNLTHRFGPESGSTEKQLLLEPVPTWGRDRPVSHWMVKVIFEPDAAEGALSGSCAIERVDLETAVAGH